MASDHLVKAEFDIRKRVECEERAFHIVNQLVDGCVDDQYFSECGKRISQENYDDIVEERSIIKLCGYPLCPEKLPNVPKKKYHISTKANKVYDISERKKFCSNQCFKASNNFKQQIPECPVWARDKKKIDIIISPHKGVPGLVGDEIIGHPSKTYLQRELEELEELDKRFGEKGTRIKETFVPKENDNPDKPNVIQSLDEDAASTNVCTSNTRIEESNNRLTSGREKDGVINDLQRNFKGMCLVNSEPEQIQTVSEKTDNCKSVTDEGVSVSKVTLTLSEQKQSESSSKLEQLQKLLNKRKNVLSGMVDLQDTARTESNNDPVGKSSSKNKVKKASSPTKEHDVKKNFQPITVQPPLYLVCQVLKRWVSVNTVEYLDFKTSHSQPMDHVSKKFSDMQIQVDCMNLSKNLESQEKQLGSLLGDGASNDVDDGVRHKELKNVPDYCALKDEAEQFQLKVTEFITGKRPEQKIKEKMDPTDNPVYIPTVDTHDQAQIRAKIVLERLDKSLPDLLIPMGLSVQDVSTHIRELVYTFRLERDTIIFKPAEWTLVSLIILKMLSLRVKPVQESFSKDLTIRHFSVLLKGIKHSIEDLDVYARELLSEATVIFDPS